MRVHIHENVHEALRFLMLGAGVVLAVRLSHLGLSRWWDHSGAGPLEEAVSAFTHGHLLPDGYTLVVHAAAPAGRMSLALLFACLCGALGALAASGIARAVRAPLRRATVQGGRTGLVLGCSWGLWAALALPPHTAHVGAEGITVRERPAFLGGPALPWPAQERMIPWASVDRIGQRTVQDHMAGCGEREQVVVLASGHEHVVAGLAPEGPDCAAALHDARTHAERLVALLQELRDAPR